VLHGKHDVWRGIDMANSFKESFRKQMLNKRKQYSQHEADACSEIICKRIGIFMDYRKAKNVMIYLPINSEVNTIPIINMCLDEGKRVFLPSIQNNEIVPCEFIGFDKLEKASFGVHEPICKDAFESLEIDLICVPGLAFNFGKYRLGYGGGYYDKFLPKLRENCFKVGLAYDFQITNLLPIEAHDFPMDIVITEDQFIGDRNN